MIVFIDVCKANIHCMHVMEVEIHRCTLKLTVSTFYPPEGTVVQGCGDVNQMSFFPSQTEHKYR